MRARYIDMLPQWSPVSIETLRLQVEQAEREVAIAKARLYGLRDRLQIAIFQDAMDHAKEGSD